MVPRLDIIINNACQTIRRPPQYYAPLIKAEIDPSDATDVQQRWTAAHRSLQALHAPPSATAGAIEGGASAAAETGAPTAETAAAAAAGTTAAPHVAGAGGAAAPSAALANARGAALPLAGTAAAAEALPAGMSLPLSAVGGGVGSVSLLSQLPIAPGDETWDSAAFPAGQTDGNADALMQLDLRPTNSWTLKLQDV